MALTSSFGFTNTTDGTHTVTPKALGLPTNYALAKDNDDVVILNNKTAPIDQEEIISFKTRMANSMSSQAAIANPAKVGKIVEYTVRLDEILTTRDSNDATFRVDEPIVCSITFRHPKSGNITDSHIATVFNRALSCLMKADGTWRFGDLMRSAERPIDA